MQFPFSFPPALCVVSGFPHKDSFVSFKSGPVSHSSRNARTHLRTVPSPNWYSSFRLFIVRPSSKYRRTIFLFEFRLIYLGLLACITPSFSFSEYIIYFLFGVTTLLYHLILFCGVPAFAPVLGLLGQQLHKLGFVLGGVVGDFLQILDHFLGQKVSADKMRRTVCRVLYVGGVWGGGFNTGVGAALFQSRKNQCAEDCGGCMASSGIISARAAIAFQLLFFLCIIECKHDYFTDKSHLPLCSLFVKAGT